MSTQKGNSSRTRSQKYKNKTAFKNNLHDTSQKTKLLNSIQINDVCQRCKEIIEWKIKYKKYKPLTQPKKCIKCDNKSVKRAYHIMCDECGQKLGLCAKCGKDNEIIQSSINEDQTIKLDQEMQELLKSLTERKRRTFIRYMNKSTNDLKKEDMGNQREDLLLKLNSLKTETDDFSECGDILESSDEDSSDSCSS